MRPVSPQWSPGLRPTPPTASRPTTHRIRRPCSPPSWTRLRSSEMPRVRTPASTSSSTGSTPRCSKAPPRSPGPRTSSPTQRSSTTRSWTSTTTLSPMSLPRGCTPHSTSRREPRAPPTADSPRTPLQWRSSPCSPHPTPHRESWPTRSPRSSRPSSCRMPTVRSSTSVSTTTVLFPRTRSPESTRSSHLRESEAPRRFKPHP